MSLAKSVSRSSVERGSAFLSSGVSPTFPFLVYDLVYRAALLGAHCQADDVPSAARGGGCLDGGGRDCDLGLPTLACAG